VEEGHADPSIRVLRVAGRLHFVAAGGLRDAIDRAAAGEGVRTLVVDLAKTQGLDLTARQVLAQVADRLRTEGRSLILVGLDKDECARFRAVGLADAVGADNFLDRTDEVPQSVG
jgi:anti-anti-sigma regulatory factor